MKEYTGFAEVYDMFMDNVPYDKWAKYLQKLLKENGAKEGIVCELGCGTGKMTRRLRDMGMDDQDIHRATSLSLEELGKL